MDPTFLKALSKLALSFRERGEGKGVYLAAKGSLSHFFIGEVTR